jgi:hypothetical protein
MMMFPQGWIDGANSVKKRLAGNAVCSPQAVTAIRLLVPRVLEALKQEPARRL